jgi:hypothetical protein
LKFEAHRNNLDSNLDTIVERHKRAPRLSSSNSLKAGMAMERLSAHILVFAFVAIAACFPPAAQHDHPAPEKLGAVEFTTRCSPQAQAQFNRSVALLHSFAYGESEKAFREVLTTHSGCAMAHWGIAMTYYHQLWEPPINETSYAKGAASWR